ncbi:MAG: hypothetical protein ACF8GE_01200 [Phycisphaerales bacterium JB043]
MLFLLCAASGQIGCNTKLTRWSSGSPEPSIDPKEFTNRYQVNDDSEQITDIYLLVDMYFEEDVADLISHHRSYKYSQITPDRVVSIEGHSSGPSPDDKQRIRNELIEKTMLMIDSNYDIFISKLSASRKGFDTSVDVGVILLGGVSTVMTPTSTKSILTQIATGLTGIKNTINKNYFYDKSLGILMKQMEANRIALSDNIYSKFGQGVDDYPLSQSVRDLLQYYRAGTLDGAYSALDKTTSLKLLFAEDPALKELDYTRMVGLLEALSERKGEDSTEQNTGSTGSESTDQDDQDGS